MKHSGLCPSPVYKIKSSVKEKLHCMFGTTDVDVLPTISEIKVVLLRRYDSTMTSAESDTFAVALAAICCAFMFNAYERSAAVPKEIWEFISEPANLRNCNWGQYILEELKAAAHKLQMDVAKGQSSIRLSGCWLYLMIMYPDSIDFGDRNIPLSRVPRVAEYTRSRISEFIHMDTRGKHRFGKIRKTRPIVIHTESTANIGKNTAKHTFHEVTGSGIDGDRNGGKQRILAAVNESFEKVVKDVEAAAKTAHIENSKL